MFDGKHKSLALLKRNANGDYSVMSECCDRTFTRQKFGEIGFLVVSQAENVRGHDTKLTVQTKERMEKLGFAC